MPGLNRGGATAVLRQPTFRWYFLARVVSLAGTAMTSVALAFAVLSFGTLADLGLIMAAHSVAMIAFILVGGVIADRLPRQAVVQTTWLLFAACQGTAGTLLLTGTASVPAFLVIETVAGAAGAFAAPAMQGLIPQVTDRSLLQEADAVMAFANASLRIAGPVVSGLLVAGPGPAWALYLDALSYLVGAACFSRVRLPRLALPPSSLLGDLRSGWSEFTARTWLWTIVLAAGVGNAAFGGAFNVIGPGVAKAAPDVGARGWGIALAGMGVGAVLATLALMRVRLSRPLLAGQVALVVMIAPILALALWPHVVPLAIACFLVGVGVQVFATGWNVALQENIPQEALSRVVSYDMLGSFVLGPLGLALYGWASSHVALRPLLLGTAAVVLTAGMLPLLVPDVRRLHRAGHDAGAEPGPAASS